MGLAARIGTALAIAGVLAGIAGAASLDRVGQLDRSFSHDGRLTGPFGSDAVGGAHDVAIDSRDRPVVVGSTFYAFATARYRPDGQLDTSFKKDGSTELHFQHHRIAFGTSVAVDDRDRIVVAGGDDGGPVENERKTDELAVARYRPNGQLDRSFSGDGTRTLNIRSSGEEIINDVAIDRKGRILALGGVGPRYDSEGASLVMVRFERDGRLDRSFGDKGVVTLPQESYGLALSLDASGRIFALSSGLDGFYGERVVFGFEPDGRTDRGFGDSGRITDPVGSSSIAVAHGTIALGGEVDHRLAVAALDKSGAADRGFGNSGVAVARQIGPDGPYNYAYANAVSIDARSRILAYGDSSVRQYADHNRLVLARFGRSGALDDSFSGDGLTVTRLKDDEGGFVPSSAQALSLDSKQRIIGASGESGFFDYVRIGLARFHG